MEHAGCIAIEVNSGSLLNYSEPLRELGVQNQTSAHTHATAAVIFV